MSSAARQWMEVVANVGVLVGIIFLIIELDQNATDTRMEAQISLSERFNEQDGSIAENPQLAELIVRADDPSTSLSAAEFRQYQAHYDRWMNILGVAFDMYTKGVLTEEDWKGYLCEVRRQYLRSQQFRVFAKTAKERYLNETIYVQFTRAEYCAA